VTDDDSDVRDALRALAADARTVDTDAIDTDAIDTDAIDTDAIDTDAIDTDAIDTDAIDEATAALDDVRDAASFVADGGLARLRRDIERADRAGDRSAARRGREALDAIERCRRAAADHFHSGRGTVLGAGAQRPPR